MAKRDLELNELNQSSGGVKDPLFQRKFRDIIESEDSSDGEVLAMIKLAPDLDTLAFATQSKRVRRSEKLDEALNNQIEKIGSRG